MDQLLRKPLDNMGIRLVMAANEVIKPSEEDKGNVIMCPFGSCVVAAMYFYAAGNGKSYQQIDNLLGLTDVDDGRADIKTILFAFRDAVRACCRADETVDNKDFTTAFQTIVRNCLFIQAGSDVKPTFLESMKKYLAIESIEVDFFQRAGGRREIQNWVADNAALLKIGDIPPLDIDLGFEGNRMAILSVSYYRGAWDTPFDRALTSWQTFYLEDGTTKEVEMMTITEKFPFFEDVPNGLKYIEIPYYKNGASLLVTIPTKEGITATKHKLTAKIMTAIVMRKRMKMVKLTLPKFSIQRSYDLERIFRLIGIRDVLNDDSDLTQLTSDPRFRAKEGQLICAIHVDERGSFTAGKPAPPVDRPVTPTVDKAKPGALGNALTKISSMKAFSGSPKPSPRTPAAADTPPPGGEILRADHPFFIALRHNKSSMLLFAGTLMSP